MDLAPVTLQGRSITLAAVETRNSSAGAATSAVTPEISASPTTLC